ncbi:hypothetical protein XENORESO_008428 [Xenotaenia resolanae]|uniref:Uncharacterized protein n=1 Tax=Xenotaenia resolanae TaxID=208358 RepID=A0ABV0X5S4_9TELE
MFFISKHQSTFVGRFPHTNQNCGKTAAEHHPPAFRQEENHEVLTSPADSLRKDKAYRWGHSEVQFEISADSIFITRVFLRLSKPKLRLEKTLEPWLGQHPRCRTYCFTVSANKGSSGIKSHVF